MFEPAWSRRTVEEDPGAPFFNDTAKYVVSSTLTTPTWRNSEIIGPYDLKRIQQLKEEVARRTLRERQRDPGPRPHRRRLVDELHLFVYPVTRSAGPRLFDESLPPATWHRADAALYDNGVTYLQLTPAA